MNVRFVGVIGGLACLLVGCPPTRPSERREPTGSTAESSRDKQTVARVNGERLSVAELTRRIDELPSYARARYRSVEKRQEYVASLVQFEVMADIAESRGLGDVPSVRDAIEQALVDGFVESKLRDEVSVDSISEEAVEEAYRENRHEYRTPPKRRTALIAADSRERLQSIRRRIVEADVESPKARLEQFRSAAARNSVDPETARSGGYLGWIAAPESEGEYPEVARAVFAIESPYRVSPIFEFEGRWAVAIYDEHRDEKIEPLDKVARTIRRRLYEKRRDEVRSRLFDEWRREVEVRTDERLADRLEAPPETSVASVEDLPIVPASEAEKSAPDEDGNREDEVTE